MALKITIAYEVSNEAVVRVEALLEHEANWNLNWNGVVFEIERGDFTCIEDGQGYNGCATAELMSKVYRAIDGFDD